MGIIVDHRNALLLPFDFEAAACAGKFAERNPGCFLRDRPSTAVTASTARALQNVMPAGHLQAHLDDIHLCRY